MAEQRKATDANGKGVEEDNFGGGFGARSKSSNYKPKLPAKSKAAAAGGAMGADGKKIPKWKLQSMQFRQAVGPA